MFRWYKGAGYGYQGYQFWLSLDTIIIRYEGPDRIYFLYPFRNKIFVNEARDILTIVDFHRVYPGYAGDEFIKMSPELLNRRHNN